MTGQSSIVVVVHPTGASHDAGEAFKHVDVQVSRYLHGTGPQTITVNQRYKCGPSRDQDYVDLRKGSEYVLFLTQGTPGIWRPFAVPMGFGVDGQGNLHPLHSNPYYDPAKFGVASLDELAARIASAENRPTQLPATPSSISADAERASTGSALILSLSTDAKSMTRDVPQPID